MEFLVKPFPHQLEAIKLSQQHKHLALLWEMGCGKTFGVINIIRLKCIEANRVKKTLIFGPIVTLYNWQEEIAKFSKIPSDRVHVLNGTGKKRVEQLERAILNHTGKPERLSIVICNWEALRTKEVYQLLMKWRPEIIVGDELHKIKSHNSITAKKAVEIADVCRKIGGNVYGLTGTMILNSIEDVYMQYRFLDGGKTFGTNFWRFKHTYMYDENAGWQGEKRFSKWSPRPEMFKDLHDKVYRIASRVTKEEAMPFLPPLIKEKRYVELSKEQARMYKEMKTEFITFLQQQEKDKIPPAVTAQLAITKALRLMQIVSGFVKDEEGNETLIPGNNPRLEACEDLLREITPNHKVILWCSFKQNYKQLGKLCDKLGLKHVFIYGGQNAKERNEGVQSFQKDDSVRVLIGNRGAGGIGINLTAASYSIVFSRNFSLGEEKQSEARNHRGGSEIHTKITKIDLIAKNTIDEQVLIALQNKQKISDLIIDWRRNNGFFNL